MRNRTLPARKAAVLRAAAFIAALAVLPSVSGADDTLPGLADILGELRKGGYVIYFRHAATDKGGPNDEAADMARCETQRGLSADGRAQATAIGKAFADLRLPVGEVVSSPFCRTRDTAQLAFGRHRVDDDLFFAMTAHVDDIRRMTTALQRMLATPPTPGTNTIIVSHTANLREAAGIWPAPEGVAYVFRPMPGGKFEPAARVPPDGWPAVAAQRPTQ